MSKQVNIPASVVDTHYRYQRDVLQIKPQGRGIGVHTKLTNLATIAQQLSREPGDVLKAFSFALAAQVRGGDIVNGHFPQDTFDTALEDFIAKFVLCGECGNPETIITPTRGQLVLRCISCGGETVCDPRNKLTDYILKDASKRKAAAKIALIEKRKEEKKKSKGKKEKKKKSKKSKKEGDAGDAEVEWSSDVSSAAVKARRREALGLNAAAEEEPEVDAEALFAEMMARDAMPEAKELQQVRDLFRLSPAELTVKICEHLLKRDELARQIGPFTQKWGAYFSSARQQRGLMTFIATLASGEEGATLREGSTLAGVVKAFYDRDCLDEEVVLEWYEEASDSMIDVKLALAPLITWFKEAEEEESSEEE